MGLREASSKGFADKFCAVVGRDNNADQWISHDARPIRYFATSHVGLKQAENGELRDVADVRQYNFRSVLASQHPKASLLVHL